MEAIENKIVFTDFKLDYMARFFRKISHKKFESYVIQRIWHRLNDDRVRFVFQQEVVLAEGRALLDLYLPQINVVVEVNEAYHEDQAQVERDLMRNAEVIKRLGATLKVVSCARTLQEVHDQIESVVDLIRSRIAEEEKQGSFLPWGGYDEMSPSYYKKLGYIEVRPYSSYVRTIDDAFSIFGAEPKHRGFLRAAGAEIPRNDEHWLVWCPNAENRNWGNELADDGIIIKEYPKNTRTDTLDRVAAKKHLEKYLQLREKRATFFKEKDGLGFNFYRFVGVFELDEELSKQEEHCVWRKICNRYPINKTLCSE